MSQALKALTFEEVIFTIIEAMQDTMKVFADTDVLAGKVSRKIVPHPVENDHIGIIGIAGDRVGYILVAMGDTSAREICKIMSGEQDPAPDIVRDTIGELANNIAGSFKTKYSDRYSVVAMGLPIVVSGELRTLVQEQDNRSGLEFQCQGVTIPFQSIDGAIKVSVMVYM